MAQVPKFGDWENDSDVPYTQYFDNAHKNKFGGKSNNPNDPHENPEASSEDIQTANDPTSKTGSDPETPKHQDEQSTSKDDDLRQFARSPLHHDVMTRKPTMDSPRHRYSDRPNLSDHQRRASRISGGSDRSTEHSPLHRQHQVRALNKGGVSSPSWERKEGGHGLGSNTPGRSRMRTGGRGDEMPDKGSIVPKFGEWDENNPASADGYTHIFDKVREEKQTGSSKVPSISTDSIYPDAYGRDSSHKTSGCGCFNWFRK